jgi:hypothetical protein
MKLDWAKWGLEFWQSIARHVGTAGTTAMAACFIDGHFDWKKFGAAILIGGVIPTTLTFLEKTPTPTIIVVESDK